MELVGVIASGAKLISPKNVKTQCRSKWHHNRSWTICLSTKWKMARNCGGYPRIPEESMCVKCLNFSIFSCGHETLEKTLSVC